MTAVKERELRLKIMSQSGDQQGDSEKLQVKRLKSCDSNIQEEWPELLHVIQCHSSNHIAIGLIIT